MPFCPVCKNEYREGIKTCSDCGHELVDSLPTEPQEEKEIFIDDEPVFLISVTSNAECARIEGCLKAFCIPFLKKSREAGRFTDVYVGYSVYGVNYFVPSKLLLKAKDLLGISSSHEELSETGEGVLPDKDEQSSKAEYNKHEAKWQTGRIYKLIRVIASIIIVVFVLAFFLSYLIGVVRGLFNY